MKILNLTRTRDPAFFRGVAELKGNLPLASKVTLTGLYCFRVAFHNKRITAISYTKSFGEKPYFTRDTPVACMKSRLTSLTQIQMSLSSVQTDAHGVAVTNEERYAHYISKRGKPVLKFFTIRKSHDKP